MISTALPAMLARTPATAPRATMRSSTRARSSTLIRVLAAHALDQRARHLGAGLVAVRVHDAVRRVRGFAPELELSARVEVELGARRLQLAHARGTLLDEHLDRGGVAQRCAGRERIPAVERRRISRAERRRDPSLGVRRRAVEQRALGEQQHVAVLRGAPRGVQARDAAADDEEAGAKSFGGGHARNQDCGGWVGNCHCEYPVRLP